MSQTIILQPGTGGTRPDWSPIAQPEDRHGVIAHTPNPSGYHDMGGRTMLPRGTEWGGSRGFSTRPGVVNVDPTDPVRGLGGITVDMERVSKEALEQAALRSGGNSIQAWALASQAQVNGHDAPAAAMPAPVPQAGPQMSPYGYVVPHTNPSGGIIPLAPTQPSWLPPAAADPMGGVPAMRPTGSPSVKPRQTMAMPQLLPEPWAQPQPQVHVVQPQAPLMDPTQPMPAQGQFVPAVQVAPPMQVVQPTATVPQQTAVPGWEMAIQQLFGAVQQLAGQVGQLQQQQQQQQPPPPAPRPWRQERAEVLAEEPPREIGPQRPPSPLEAYGLGFLYPEPVRPWIEVIFDLGQGGIHSKRYHHVECRRGSLSLIVDTRYDGDYFVPPLTPEGQTITVSVPSKQLEAAAINPGFHQRIGCLDITNLVLVPPDRRVGGPPVASEEQLDEVYSLSGMTGGEGWRNEE